MTKEQNAGPCCETCKCTTQEQINRCNGVSFGASVAEQASGQSRVATLPAEAPCSKDVVKRYVLRVGHSDDAGLGGEGWVVRMSDHFSSCEPAQKWVKAEDYEARVDQYRGALQMIAEGKCPALAPSMTAEQIARAALGDSPPSRNRVTLNGYQLKAALEFVAPDGDADQLESEVSIQWGDANTGHSGAGYYCCMTEYPEEGSVLLLSHQLHHISSSPPNGEDDVKTTAECVGESNMIVDVEKIDGHMRFLQREISRLVEIGSPWASRSAAQLQEISEILRQLRQDKQMTGIGGKRIADNGTG